MVSKLGGKAMNKRGFNEGTVLKRDIIHKDGKITQKWEARIQIGRKENGKPLIKSFSSTKSKQDVIDKLNEFKKEDIDLILRTDRVVYKEYLNTWYEHYRKPLLKSSSADRVEFFIKMISNRIGHYTIQEINSRIVQGLVNELKDEGYARETIKKSKGIIYSSLESAINKGYISRNPAKEIIIPTKFQFNQKKIEILSDNEIERFKVACSECHSNGKPKVLAGFAFIFMLNTGLRIGEMIALKWDKVDLKNKSIMVCRNAVRVRNKNSSIKTNWVIEVQESLKTQSSYRKIALNENAINALLTIKKHRYFGERSFVFPSTENTPVPKENFQRSLNSINERADISHKGTHGLRHTFAS